MRVQLGVSACLLGEPVCFDGSHKYNHYLTKTLGRFFQLQPICPESAIGMRTPRQAIRLVGNSQAPRAIGVKNPQMDVSAELRCFGREYAQQYRQLSGFVVKKDSPSCGLEKVRVFNQGQPPIANGRGLFTEQLMKEIPLLPVIEEADLADSQLRENFIERVFLYHRWQKLVREGVTAKSLLNFHTEHKYALMSRSQQSYKKLGQLIASIGCDKARFQELVGQYISQLMVAMGQPASRNQHVNVLLHLMGYLKRELSTEEKAELLQDINHYRKGSVPLSVPMMKLKHHLNCYPNTYLDRQRYFSPYLEPRSLSNHP